MKSIPKPRNRRIVDRSLIIRESSCPDSHRLWKTIGSRCSWAYSSTRTSVSTPSVALDTTQRRKNISTASTMPIATAAAPRTYSPRRSDSAIGPSTTARVTSGTTIAAAMPRPARTAMVTKRSAYGRR